MAAIQEFFTLKYSFGVSFRTNRSQSKEKIHGVDIINVEYLERFKTILKRHTEWIIFTRRSAQSAPIISFF